MRNRNWTAGLTAVTLAMALGVCSVAGWAADQRTMVARNDNHAVRRGPHQVPPNRVVPHPRVGEVVRSLPRGHREVRVGRRHYGYYDGVFYHSRRPDTFVVVRAPYGARVRRLPPGYVSFFIGPRHYFYVNFTYFLWDPRGEEYVVVKEPEGAEKEVVAASQAGSGPIFVYPKEGQSDEQRDRDRYECYVWAVEQTGYDPSADNPDVGAAGDYRRAFSACLEGRGYTVK